jgi:hypothetical protein
MNLIDLFLVYTSHRRHKYKATLNLIYFDIRTVGVQVASKKALIDFDHMGDFHFRLAGKYLFIHVCRPCLSCTSGL